MLVSELSNSLEFNDYLLVADEIRKIFLGENSASIFQGQCRQRDCWNAAMFEFNAETFLVNRLVKTTALVFVNFEAGANNGVTFVFEYKVRR